MIVLGPEDRQVDSTQRAEEDRMHKKESIGEHNDMAVYVV